jgi:transcriptional regulator with XRE-family HTH domain
MLKHDTTKSIDCQVGKEKRMENNLRSKREASGLNQRELAEKAHIPQSTVSELERGARKPWFKVAKKLARVLKVPIHELFPQDFPVGGQNVG